MRIEAMSHSPIVPARTQSVRKKAFANMATAASATTTLRICSAGSRAVMLVKPAPVRTVSSRNRRSN